MGSLRAELSTLCKGRGLARSNPRGWIGPGLQRILDLDAGASDNVYRDRLRGLLVGASDALPADLRFLFLAALGEQSDLPFLEARLEEAGELLDRGVRALRRHLREAERLVAEHLIERHRAGSHPFAEDAWHWRNQEMCLSERPDPGIVLGRTLVSLQAGLDSLVEVFTIPATPGEGAVTFTAGEGVLGVDVQGQGGSTWQVTLRVAPMRLGESRWTQLRVGLPSVDVLKPYLALAPVRRHTGARVTVDFGSPPFATTAWVLDAVLPTQLGAPRGGAEVVNLSNGPVSVPFEGPRPGFVYGLGWEWAPGRGRGPQ